MQVENLRRELEDCKAAAKRHLEAELARIDASWKAKVADIATESAAKIDAEKASAADRIAAADEIHKREMGIFQKSFEDSRNAQVSALEEELAAERKRAAEAADIADRQHADNQAAMDALAKEREDCIAQLRADNTAMIKNLKEDLRTQLNTKHEELTLAHARELAQLTSKHEAHIEEMTTLHSNRILEAKRAHESAMNAADRSRRDHIDQVNAAAAAEKAKALQDLRKNLMAERTGAIDDLTAKFETEKNELKGELAVMTNNFNEKSRECSARDCDLLQRSEELRLACIDRDEKLAEAALQEATKLSDLRQAHSREFSKLSEEYQIEKEHLRSSMQQEYDMLENDFLALQERWETRESRPEDLDRIRQLEEQMIEKDKLVKKTMEEMVFFKRELLNREENFNKRFNNNVNVGVMQVIKPKKDGARNQGGKSSKKIGSSVGASGPVLGVGRM